MLDGGSMKSEGTCILLLKCKQDTFLGDMKQAWSQPRHLVAASQQRLLGQLLRDFIAVQLRLIQYSVSQTPANLTEPILFYLESLSSRTNTYFWG